MYSVVDLKYIILNSDIIPMSDVGTDVALSLY